MNKVDEGSRDDDMLDEYDFRGGVRGKYARRFAEGSNVVVLDPEVVGVLDGHFDDDLARSVPVEPDQWSGRSRARRAEEATVGFLARHL